MTTEQQEYFVETLDRVALEYGAIVKPTALTGCYKLNGQLIDAREFMGSINNDGHYTAGELPQDLGAEIETYLKTMGVI